MKQGTDRVSSHPFLWIVVITVVTFNVAAGMSHDGRLA